MTIKQDALTMLHTMRDHIALHGWVPHDAEDEAGHPCGYDDPQAVRRGLSASVLFFGQDYDWSCVVLVYEELVLQAGLADAVGEDHHEGGHDYERRLQHALTDWEDEAGRTQDHVLDVVDGAITTVEAMDVQEVALGRGPTDQPAAFVDAS